MGLPQYLNEQCQTVFLRCGPFVSDSGTKALFVDERINPWQSSIPETNNAASRISHIIDFLHDKYNENQENALVLLVRVIRDRADTRDACHSELEKLANDLEQILPTSSRADIDKDIVLLNSLLEIIKPSDVHLNTPFSDIISSQYDRLKVAFDKLEEKRDWKSLIRVKEILSEYFEYTGKYDEGAEVGRRYYRALKELSNDTEAIWTRIKHIGYLLILAGRHTEGRREIEEALKELALLTNRNSETVLEALFYANRYLGISYHRDSIKVDLDKAHKYYRAAEEIVLRFSDSNKRNELRARIQGNYGNLAISQGKYSKALNLFRESYGLFLELRDKEHIGIAELQMVEALNHLGEKDPEYENVEFILEDANLFFNQIMWIEGQARAYKYYSTYYRQRFGKASTVSEKKHFIRRALRYANLSKALYEQIRKFREVGKTEERIESMQDELVLLGSESNS